MKDFQRQRVYDWERAHVAPHDHGRIAFAAIQPMVNAIWAELGLRYPPKVERLDKRITRHAAQATRTTLWFGETAPSWLILHEVAHALGSTHDDLTDGHGPLYVGLYVQLLERYMRLSPTVLRETLRAHRVAFQESAQPLFIMLA